MTHKLLITDTHVVSLDPQIGTLASADVLVVDGLIAQIGPHLGVTDADHIDGAGTITLPGFVDTHRHTFQAAIRGKLPHGTMGEYFVEVLLGYSAAFAAEDMYAGNLIGAYEALNAGVTTIVDWCNATNTPAHADAAITALQETGIRAMFAYGPSGGIAGYGPTTHPADSRRVREQYFSSSDQLLTYALALRGPVGLPTEINRADFELARELDARITVHAGMRQPGMPNGEVRLMQQDGLLGPDVTIVHANETDGEELDWLADAGSTVSVAPYVELLMGHGHPPTNRLLDHGLQPSLSMDVACSVPGDMFTQMRTALIQSRGAQIPATPADPFAPDRSVVDVLRFATINGAAACGLSDRIGSLAVGKDADLILIRSDAINTMPGDDPYATVVTAADTSNVDTVLVRGRAVKRHGQLLGVDLPRLRRLGSEARDRVMAASAVQTAGQAAGQPA